MILLTGGSGLLGQEIQKHIECYAPSHEEFDITKPFFLSGDIDLIIHCAAYTDVTRAEEERKKCWETNVTGTDRLVSTGVPVVYISTEYIFEGGVGNYSEEDVPYPQNFYALTKTIGEAIVTSAREYLIIRTLFKPRPYKHAIAPIDQFTTGDYVDVITPIIIKVINIWNKNKTPCVINVGTNRKSTYDLAKQSRPEVKPCLLSDIKSVKLPRDTSLNLKKLEKFW